MTRQIAALLGLLTMSGCAFVANDGITTEMRRVKGPTLWANLEVMSLVATKKTMVDHVATWVTGRNCWTVRAERQGTYCVDWPTAPMPPPEVYCYTSLARPTCYSQPYTQGNDRLIGLVPPSTPLR